MAIKYKEKQLDVEEQLLEYKYLVKNVVRGMNVSIPAGMNEEDLMSFGFTGLHKAIKTHDSSKGAFVMYAKCKIRHEVIDGLRSFGTFSRSMLEKKRDMQKAMAALENKFNRQPTKEEIMEYLQIDESKYKKYIECLNYGIDFSLNDVFQSSGDEVEEYFSLSGNSMLDRIEEEELKKYLVSLLDDLNDKAREIIFLYFYRNCTYKKIAAVLNISESTVGEILNRTLAYLKIKIVKDGMLER